MRTTSKKIDRNVNITIVMLLAIATMLIFGYNAIIMLLTAMGNVEIGGVPFLVEGAITLIIWALIAMFYVYLGRKTNYYQRNKPSMVLIYIAIAITAFFVISWILRPQELAAAMAMINCKYANPKMFDTLNLAGAICIGCAVGIVVGYYFFAKKVVIDGDDNFDSCPTEKKWPRISSPQPKVLYDEKTAKEKTAKQKIAKSSRRRTTLRQAI